MSGLGAVMAELAALGAHFDPLILQRTRALYRPLVAGQPWMARAVVADIPYGPDPRHRLDVYPADSVDAPVLLFVHGGGFVGGDKGNDPPFYGNVGRYFAQAGYCTVTMNYRLAQTHGWPAGAEDVAAALRWVASDITRHSDRADTVLLLGQSAGASHCASYLFDPRIAGTERRHIRAAALMSGFYLAAPPLAPGPLRYFGEDRSTWTDRSPATHVAAGHPPLLLSVAELDPGEIAIQTVELARALTLADGRAPQLQWFGGHNHVSTIHGLGLGEDKVGTTLDAFFRDAMR